MENLLNSIRGAAELVTWFGRWPSFHDAEIVSLTLNRAGVSTLQVYTWEMTPKLDELGYYILEKKVLVNFRMEEITTLTLSDFNPQNVISGLTLARTDDSVEIRMHPCFGLAGSIAARKLSIGFAPVSDEPV